MEILFDCLSQEVDSSDLQLNFSENQQKYEKFVSGVYTNRFPDLTLLFNLTEKARRRENFEEVLSLYDSRNMPKRLSEEANRTIIIDDPRKLVPSLKKYLYTPPVIKSALKPESQSLLIINPYISTIDLFYTFCTLPSLKNLKIFTFCNIEFKNDVLLVLLTRGIGSLVNLETLNISNCRVPKRENEGKLVLAFERINQIMRNFVLSLLQLKKIKEICLLNNSFLKNLLEFSGIFSYFTEITGLRIGSNKKREIVEPKPSFSVVFDCIAMSNRFFGTNVDSFQIIEELYCRNFDGLASRVGYLKVLHLRKVRNISFELFKSICLSPSLEDIDLSYNNLSHQIFENIRKSSSSNLKTLQLSGNSFESINFYDLINKILNLFPSLVSLSLDDNKMQEFRSSRIIQHLNLKHLVLDLNSIGSYSIEIIQILIQNLRSLEIISMKECLIRTDTFLWILNECQGTNIKFNLRNNFILCEDPKGEKYSTKIYNFLKENETKISGFKALRINSKNLVKKYRNKTLNSSLYDPSSLINLEKLSRFLGKHRLKPILY
jgi:hypothetical protein